jgi:chromosomal replication initiation ATPase DnaA
LLTRSCDNHNRVIDWQAKPAAAGVALPAQPPMMQRLLPGQRLKSPDTFVVGQSNELAYNAAKRLFSE